MSCIVCGAEDHFALTRAMGGEPVVPVCPRAPSLPPPKPVTWRCLCCGRAVAWKPKVGAVGAFVGPPIVDRAPHVVEVAGKKYDACSYRCAGRIWFVKSLEVDADRWFGPGGRAVLPAQGRDPGGN